MHVSKSTNFLYRDINNSSHLLRPISIEQDNAPIFRTLFETLKFSYLLTAT